MHSLGDRWKSFPDTYIQGLSATALGLDSVQYFLKSPGKQTQGYASISYAEVQERGVKQQLYGVYPHHPLFLNHHISYLIFDLAPWKLTNCKLH